MALTNNCRLATLESRSYCNDQIGVADNITPQYTLQSDNHKLFFCFPLQISAKCKRVCIYLQPQLNLVSFHWLIIMLPLWFQFAYNTTQQYFC